MFSKIVLVGALLTASSPAYAHDWWMINRKTAQCVSTVKMANVLGISWMTTPDSVEQYYQNQGYSVYPTAHNTTDGSLVGVDLSVSPPSGGQTQYFDFYTSAAFCQEDLSADLANGSVVNPNDMN